ncbi:hypothetical protein BH10BAC2_BH10BAC2_43240 [soil metagenome]
MKITFTLLISLAILFKIQAQQTFQQIIYKTDASKGYTGGNIAPALDGGFIFCGNDNINGYNITNLCKFNNSGTLEWMRAISKRLMDNPHAVQMADGSIFVGGSWSANKLDLIKTDALGNTVWAKSYTINTFTSFNAVSNIIRSADGSIVILSYDSDLGIGITKIDAATGAVIIDRHYITFLHMLANNIYQTKDNGFVLVGNNGILKTDANLNVQWCKTIHTHTAVGNVIIRSEAVTESQDGGFVIAGSNWNASQIYNTGHLIKLDGTGNAVWHKQFSSNLDNYFYDITKNQDSSFTVVGSSNSPFGISPPYSYGSILNVSNDATLRWSNFISGQKPTVFKSVIKSVGKTSIAVGTTTSFGRGKGAFFISQFTNKGITCANKQSSAYTVTNMTDSIVNQSINSVKNYTAQMIVEDIDPSLTVNTPVIPIVQSTCLTTTAAKDFSVERIIEKNANVFNAIISPNPVAGNSIQLEINAPSAQNMQLMIINTEGVIIMQSNIAISAGKNNKKLDISKLFNGAYFLKLQGTKDQKVIQFIKAN